jgi:DNA repair protein RecN (Recombination protein N)
VRKEVIDPEGKASKKSDNVRTVVRIEALDADERRLELAAIAGGDAAQGENGAAKAAVDFADSLLAQAVILRSGQTVESEVIPEKTPKAKAVKEKAPKEKVAAKVSSKGSRKTAKA